MHSKTCVPRLVLTEFHRNILEFLWRRRRPDGDEAGGSGGPEELQEIQVKGAYPLSPYFDDVLIVFQCVPYLQVDRKASKGRKIKYVAHEKLANFMFPTPGVHEDSSFDTDRLYKSLFQ